jgi:hypothetical protein
LCLWLFRIFPMTTHWPQSLSYVPGKCTTVIVVNLAKIGRSMTGEYCLFRVRGKKTGGRHATSKNITYSKLQFWSMFGSHFKHVLDQISSMFGSHFKHVWITFQAHFKNKHAVLPSFKIHVCQSHLKQFWSMFWSYFKHVSRTNTLCYPVSKIVILEHVWITSQACLNHISSTFQARLDHISSTFQEQTCCVTQFQNSCVPITLKAILEHVWITFQAYLDHISSTFQARLDHVSRTNMLCYPVSKFMCQSQYNLVQTDQIGSSSRACLNHISSTF